MKKIVTYWLIAVTLVFATIGVAKEPRNLSASKQEVMRYYESHQYDEDVSKIIASAMRYLDLRLKQPHPSNKKPAIVLDIDETSLSNYPSLVKMNFGGTNIDFKRVEKAANDPVIAPTLKLYRYAKAHNIAVLFITGRDEDERVPTIQNLQTAGYKSWDALFLRTSADKNKTAAIYKTALRKQLSQSYDIILNIGDQKSDLVGGYADKSFKLPNPFYYIP